MNLTAMGAEDEDRVRGCLLGGAIGDALGAPVEFLSRNDIQLQFGPLGIRWLMPPNAPSPFTDDTQMTLFTAEGLLRAISRGNERGVCHPPSIIHHAYLRWLRTQVDFGVEPPFVAEYPGWLIRDRRLHVRRSPGNTCVTALQSGRMGTMEMPINDSKGCGGVMRAASIGLIDLDDPFTLGCESAAITHGHPSGYIAAGCFAHMIASLRSGRPMAVAVEAAIERAEGQPGHEEVTTALRRAVALAASVEPSALSVELLGAGWVAEEALAIAVYCALVHEEDFEEGVILAVNHSGDSDSTGSMTGNLLGTRLGVEGIPPRWIEQIDMRDVLDQIAGDLVTRYEPGDAWWDRYPGC